MKKKSPTKKKRHAGQPQNLTPGRRGKPTLDWIPPAAWETFAVQLAMTGRRRQSAVRSGYASDYGPELAKHPWVVQRLTEITQEMRTKELIRVGKEHALHADLLDDELVKVVVSHSHEKRGYADKVSAIRHGNELLGRVRSGTTINNSANAAARANSTAGQNAFEIYESSWLTRKKEGWSRQLQEKYGNDTDNEAYTD